MYGLFISGKQINTGDSYYEFTDNSFFYETEAGENMKPVESLNFASLDDAIRYIVYNTPQTEEYVRNKMRSSSGVYLFDIPGNQYLFNLSVIERKARFTMSVAETCYEF